MDGQPLARLAEAAPLVFARFVAFQSASMRGVQMRMIDLPDLVAQPVLEGVAALLPERMGEDMAVFDEEWGIGAVVEVGRGLAEFGFGGRAVVGGAAVFDPEAPEFAEFFAAEINPEEIISRNPEAIVFGVSGPAQEEETREYLHSTFPDVAAVENDVLIAVSQADLHPGTLGNIDAVETIAEELHPGAF